MHLDHEEAVHVINDHLNWLEKQVVSTYAVVSVVSFEDRFAQMCYSKSALNDLYTLLEDNQDIPASILIEEYADKMDKYSCMNVHASIMFSVAHDIAMAVLWDLKK